MRFSYENVVWLALCCATSPSRGAAVGSARHSPPHCLYRHRYRYRSDTALVEAFNLRAAVHVRQKHWDAAR
jgi:hypothetical protein